MSVPFKFNFDIPDSSIEQVTFEQNNEDLMGAQNLENVSNLQKRTVKEVFVDESHYELSKRLLEEKLYFSLQCKTSKAEENIDLIYYCSVSSNLNINEENSKPENILEKINKFSTDLIPGEYEGGFKVWECSNDLIEYLLEININLESANILELGCGAGLPGILCLSKGANVYFQDYNEEVINMSTIPNVIINAKFNEKLDQTACKFYSGDWNFVEKKFYDQNVKFDYILASETIYNPSNYEAFYSIIKSSLKKTGTVYIAAKVCYFGVGGGVESFKHFVDSKKYFKTSTCKTYDNGNRCTMNILNKLNNEETLYRFRCKKRNI